jgi:glycosyltransferase involved in cell wall biosynthesis
MSGNNQAHPFFSIVIPTLNEEKYLPLLLSNLAEQSWTDFEVIHVDGGSTDQTVAEAESWHNKLVIKTIVHDVKNVSAQRNRGASAARGDWIIFMDADDQLPKYFLLGIKYQLEQREANPKDDVDVFTTLIHLNQTDRRDPRNQTSAHFINGYLSATGKTNRPRVLGSMIGARNDVFQKIQFNEKSKVNEDSIFVHDCVQAGFRYLVFHNPTYAYSMRRIKSNGMMRTATSSLIMSLRYSIGDDFSKHNYGYKMLGGSAYDKESVQPKKNKSEE